jgi:hypothetical protein
MSIVVTPIPRLSEFAAPALTLGTANAAGTASSVLSTDSTLLAFDATVPDAITFGQSGAAGSAVVAARRDHQHEMAALTNTTVGAFDSSVKVWGYSSNDGTLQSPSYNLDSMTDGGTGIRTPVITTDFSDADYSIAVQVRTGSAVGTHSDISAIAVGSFTWKIYNNSTDALQDSEGGFQAIGEQ